MNDLISICIPTFNRLELLTQAIESCWAQTYPDLEILVADDSTNDDTQNAIAQLSKTSPHPLRYVRNQPPLGQAGNVNRLFDMAQGERFVLLHDDDLLLPNAVSDLAACWEKHPDLTAAYGKQFFITLEGELQDDAEKANARFSRVASKAGIVLSAMEAALLQQFPNDGYMMKTAVARQVRYRDKSEVGTNRWCDYDFGIRVAAHPNQHPTHFYFLNNYTAKYRIVPDSVAKQGYPTYMFPFIEALSIDAATEWARKRALRRLAPVVISNYVRSGNKRQAWRIFLSSYYPFHQRISKAGIYRLLLLLAPSHQAFDFLRDRSKRI